MIRKRSLLPSTLLIFGALALAGCPDGDDDGSDVGTDTGPGDMGSEDSGVDTGVDTGVDAGVDTGVVDSGEDNCLPNNTVDVDGTNVTVDEATMEATISGGASPAILSCRNPPPPQFANDYCLVECVDFLGYTPTAEEIQQLEVAVFPLFNLDTMMPVDSDPTFDHQTGIDNDPQHRAPIGYAFSSPPNTECPSGWQIELGYIGGPGAGAETLIAETPYVIRVRSVQTSTPAWAETYYWRFIRRNDEVPAVAACGIDEARVPSIRYTFPIIHRSIVEQAIASAGAPIPGSGDLDDGLGSGYAIVEARDCSNGGGQPMANATVGLTPTPIADVYVGNDYELNRTALYTSDVGHWFAIGFDEMTETSSMALEVKSASGVTSDGTCTEAFAAGSFPVYPDAVTFFRFNRENSIIQ